MKNNTLVGVSLHLKELIKWIMRFMMTISMGSPTFCQEVLNKAEILNLVEKAQRGHSG